MRRILVINGNPKSSSFCRAITQTYADSARQRREVRVVDIGNLRFNADLDMGYTQPVELEEDLQWFQQQLQWANHIVIACPVWWGSMPAKFKGLFDRALLPGFAFQYHKGKAIPEKLLKGRTAELFITLDTPPLWYKWVQKRPIYFQLKYSILHFVGIKNIATHYFGPVIQSDAHKRKKWLQQVKKWSV